MAVRSFALTFATAAAAVILCWAFRDELLAAWLAPFGKLYGPEVYFEVLREQSPSSRATAELFVAISTTGLLVMPVWTAEAWMVAADLLGSPRARRLSLWVGLGTAAALTGVGVSLWHYAPALYLGLFRT